LSQRMRNPRHPSEGICRPWASRKSSPGGRARLGADLLAALCRPLASTLELSANA
jgi:hypothetical protein